MNYIQFGLFFVYVFSVLIAGVRIYFILNNNTTHPFNKIVFWGEVLLLGSILLVGELFMLSFAGLYKAFYLWGVVLLNYTFLFSRSVRKTLFSLFDSKPVINVPSVIFILLLSIFIFRNCYFLIDVDSNSTYLFTQKLWVSSGTSLIGNAACDIRIFNPQFDAVPYSLGISLFGQETLFPELINLFWRIIALLLVFGYTTYRFNSYYGLAASIFVIFNDHFFYSGANQWVIINPVVISLMFASAYNFWQARIKNNSLYFVLALIFSSQLMANKYQIVFTFLFLVIIGILIQNDIFNKFKDIFKNKKWFWAIAVAIFLTFMWYIKNYIVTGDPFFPVLAGVFKSFGWTAEKGNMFLKFNGGLNPLKCFKYMSFLFVWPGINPAKYVIFIVLLLPLILFAYIWKHQVDKDKILELCYWLGISILSVLGICLANWQDPRGYRFFIGIEAFTAILAIRFMLKYCFKIGREIVLSVIIIILAIPGYRIMFQGGDSDPFKRPTFKENIGVLLNKIHMDYIINKHIPKLIKTIRESEIQKERINRAAWLRDDNSYAFLLDILSKRPALSLWCTTAIKWDSYSDKELVLKDLRQLGIEWVVNIGDNGELLFIPLEEYASMAVKYDRYPKKICYDYGFPSELTTIN